MNPSGQEDVQKCFCGEYAIRFINTAEGGEIQVCDNYPWCQKNT